MLFNPEKALISVKGPEHLFHRQGSPKYWVNSPATRAFILFLFLAMTGARNSLRLVCFFPLSFSFFGSYGVKKGERERERERGQGVRKKERRSRRMTPAHAREEGLCRRCTPYLLRYRRGREGRREGGTFSTCPYCMRLEREKGLTKSYELRTPLMCI